MPTADGTKERKIALYTSMLRIRLFEERIVELYPAQEMKCPVHLCIGQEAIASGVAINLNRDDYLFSNHRGHGHYLAKGGAMRPLMAEFYGRTTGCSRAKGGSMHIVDVEAGILGTSAIVGGGIPMGVGAALASRMKGDGRVTAILFGDGAYDEGVFYESFNFAALKRLPVVFVCENNLYATNSHQSARQPVCKIAASAETFGAPGICVDGNDVMAVNEAALTAVERARSGAGPTLIEATTYRWKGHVGPEADFEKGCRPEEELTEWVKRCPVKNFRKTLTESGLLTEAVEKELRDTITTEIDDAVDFALKSPLPDKAELYEDIYSQ
jgi:pyruvate dehydrogenase E1 component alpha subunit